MASHTEIFEVLLLKHHKDGGLQHNGAPPHSALIVRDISNSIFHTGLAMVNKHLMHHYPGHDKILTLQHYVTLCGALPTDNWLHTAITTMGSCTQLWSRQEDVAHQAVLGTQKCTHRST